MKRVLLAVSFLFVSQIVWAQDLTELIKRDINAERRTLVSEAMEVPVEKEAEFWQIYNDMETELDRVMDMRVTNIKRFADNADNMTDEVADQLAKTYIDIHATRIKVFKTYYKKFGKLMNKVEAARFIQVMDQIQLLIDVQIAAELPLIE